MAVVYRAVQQPLGREVALKALSSELFQDDGFVMEIEVQDTDAKHVTAGNIDDDPSAHADAFDRISAAEPEGAS